MKWIRCESDKERCKIWCWFYGVAGFSPSCFTVQEFYLPSLLAQPSSQCTFSSLRPEFSLTSLVSLFLLSQSFQSSIAASQNRRNFFVTNSVHDIQLVRINASTQLVLEQPEKSNISRDSHTSSDLNFFCSAAKAKNVKTKTRSAFLKSSVA